MLTLKEDGRWSSTFTEQRACDEKKDSPAVRTAFGIFTAEGDQILLESEGAKVWAVLQEGRLDITVAGPHRRPPFGKDCNGRPLSSQKNVALRLLENAATKGWFCPQKAVYTLELPRE